MQRTAGSAHACVHAYVCVVAYACVCVRVRACVHMRVCACAVVHLSVSVRVRARVRACICLSARVRAWRVVCVCMSTLYSLCMCRSASWWGCAVETRWSRTRTPSACAGAPAWRQQYNAHRCSHLSPCHLSDSAVLQRTCAPRSRCGLPTARAVITRVPSD